MEYIKRKILLENYVDRNDNSPTYGELTATTFYVNINLFQDMDDMGRFTDVIYIPKEIGISEPVDYSALTQKLSASGITFPFMNGSVPTNMPTVVNPITRVVEKDVTAYYTTIHPVVTGKTASRVEDVRSYDNVNKYVLTVNGIPFDTNAQVYTAYTGNSIKGVDRVTSLGNPFTYVFGADKTDPNIGTVNQANGLVFQDITGTSSIYTSFSYKSEGWNAFDVSLSALTKEEYLLGIISAPEVESDVFIDRGIVTVYDRHLRMSEITNLDELVRYGKGYYNIILG
jgi:hypothetical protein